jgi:hypothetical protein
MNTIARQLIPFALAIAASTGVIVTPFATAAQAAELSDAGSFKASDRGYAANGSVQIIRLKDGGRAIKLSSAFKVRSGPDLRVWLSASSNPTNAGSVKGERHIDLGRLKSNKGEQVYRIPAGIDISELDSVVIWCRAFGVNFGGAKLG